MDCSPSGFSVHGILQVRILEWLATSSVGELSDPGIKPVSLALQAGFYHLSRLVYWVLVVACGIFSLCCGVQDL